MPLLLAHHAHDRLVAEVAYAHALVSTALDLHTRREEVVALQHLAALECRCELDSRSAHEDELLRHRLFAAVTLHAQLLVGAARGELRLEHLTMHSAHA